MSETVAAKDFIELNYTGKLKDGTVFDTTEKTVAEANGLPVEREFTPAIICIGEGQLLPGLDAALAGKEVGKEYTIPLEAKDAFGKRDIKKMKIVPMSTFKEHKVKPQAGLQVEVDGEMGTITRVSGGRVIVNFNHPLAGKDLDYTITITKKVTDTQEQISSYLQSSLRLPLDAMKVEVTENAATIEFSLPLPEPVLTVLDKKLSELTGVTVKSSVKAVKKN